MGLRPSIRGVRVEERVRLPVRQDGLRRASVHADRLGQRLEVLWAAPLPRVCGALAHRAREG